MTAKAPKTILFVICSLLILLIIGFILPAFLPYSPPKRIVCITNIRTLGLGCRVYCMDNGNWPSTDKWCDLLHPYFEEDERNRFVCPIDKLGPCSYAMNKNIPADTNELPPDLVLVFESVPGWNKTGGPEDVVTDRHGEKNPGANISFADGHVEFVKPEDIPNLRWTIDNSNAAGN